jgi:hypothetical protein
MNILTFNTIFRLIASVARILTPYVSRRTPASPFTPDSSSLPLAGFAQSIQLQLMALHLEAVLPRHILLKRLDALILELQYGAALCTDEMIVVRAGARMFVTGKPVLEPPLLGKPRFGQEFERPVHRGKADAGVRLPDACIKLFGAQVPAGLDKDLENLVPLAG